MVADYAPCVYACQAYARTHMDSAGPPSENHRMNSVNQALGKAIAHFRAAADGMSQVTLAEKAGTEQPAISRIEKGKQEVTAPTLAKIALALGVTVSQIWAMAESNLAPLPARANKARPVKGNKAAAVPDELKAVNWILAAVIGYLGASRPDEAPVLIAALERLPEDFRTTGPGKSMLDQLRKLHGVESSRAG